MFGDKSLQCLNIKKGGTGYKLASFLPVNLFASRKAGKYKQENFQCDSLVLVHETIAIDFLMLLVQKCKEQIHWKSNTHLRWNFFWGKWIWGLKIQVNILTFTAGRQASGFHVLVSIWTTSRACVASFKSPRPRPVGRRRPIRRRCLRSLMFSQSSLVTMFIPVILSRFQTYQSFLAIPVITGPP